MASVYKPDGARKYVISYKDENGRWRKQTATSQKRTSDDIARDIESRVALRRQGIVDPRAEAYAAHDARPLSDHLAAWVGDLRARGNTPKHVELYRDRAARVVAIVLGARLEAIDSGPRATRQQRHQAAVALAGFIKSARLSDLSTDRVQAALATLRDSGRSLGTCNHHRGAIQSFSHWCHRAGRTREHALRGVAGFNAREDRRHDRRTIAVEDLRALIAAAAKGPAYRRMTGPSRAICYRLAVATGLRYSEIRSVTPESFVLVGSEPTVTVTAACTKNRQHATLPLPPDLARDLDGFLAEVPAGSPVFPLPDKGADMLRVDLEAAGIPYRDAANRVYDFHSLRCQLATMADAAGVSPRMVQKLMRHSTLELSGRYTRPRAADLAGATAALPSLAPEPSGPEAAGLAATGTNASRPPEARATAGATEAEASNRKPLALMQLAEMSGRVHNPQVSGSSPDAGI